MKNPIKRLMILLAAFLLVFAAGLPAAQAASPHFKHGGEPVCTVTVTGSSSSTTCKAVITGLGNENLRAIVTVSGSAVYLCQNKGGNTAPGQNKVLEGPVTEPTDVPSSAIKNGNLTLNTVAAVLSADSTVSGAAAGCPNGNWSGVNPVLTVTSISLVIEQPVGTVIFTCSASDPNGITGSVALSC